MAPFSVRPLPGAPVSMPLAWREVNRKLDIRKHTIKTVPERMRKLKKDPLAEVLELSPDLGACAGAVDGGAAVRFHAVIPSAARDLARECLEDWQDPSLRSGWHG